MVFRGAKLSSAKNSEGLAGRSGALSARQRTLAYPAYVKDDNAAPGGPVRPAGMRALVN